MNRFRTFGKLGAATLLVVAPVALGGCGGSSSRGSAPSLQSAPNVPSSALASVSGALTRVDASTAGLAGTSVTAITSGAPLVQTVTDALGHFSFDHLPPHAEIELEIGDADPAHHVHLGLLEASEHVSVRCHLDAGRLSAFALMGPGGRAHVRSHLEGAVHVEIETERSSGAIQATLSASGAVAGSVVHLVDADEGTEIAHATAGADGSVHLELAHEVEGELELRDDAGNVLASGSAASLPENEVELEAREHAHAALSLAPPATGTVELELEHGVERIDIRLRNLTPGEAIDVRLETSPGTFTVVGSVTADARGRARLRLGGDSQTAIPAHLSDLSGRGLELDSGATVRSKDSLPHVSPDF